MPQCAEKRFAVRQIDAREERERRLLVPATGRDRCAEGRAIQRAHYRIGIKDRAPLGVGRNIMREHRS